MSKPSKNIFSIVPRAKRSIVTMSFFTPAKFLEQLLNIGAQINQEHLKFIILVWMHPKYKHQKENLRENLILILTKINITSPELINKALSIILSTKHTLNDVALQAVKKLIPLVEINCLYTTDQVSSGGVSFFHLAAKLGNEEIIKLLIARNPESDTLHATFNDGKSKDEEGLNALQLAIKNAGSDPKALSVVQELMKGRIKKGRTHAQKLAQKRGFIETANFLAAQIDPKLSKSRSNSESETEQKYGTPILLKSKSRANSAADVGSPSALGLQLDVKVDKPKTEPMEIAKNAAERARLGVSGTKASVSGTTPVTPEFHSNPAGLSFSPSPSNTPVKKAIAIPAAIPLYNFNLQTLKFTS